MAGRRIRVERAPGGALQVNDAPVVADLRQLDARTWSVLVDGTSHELVVLARDPLRVLVDGTEVGAAVADERELRATRAGGAARATTLEIRAPMPGLLKAVHVTEGATVLPGAPLVTLEAMKMENELRAPGPGTVTRVAVAAGTKVDAGALLVILRP